MPGRKCWKISISAENLDLLRILDNMFNDEARADARSLHLQGSLPGISRRAPMKVVLPEISIGASIELWDWDWVLSDIVLTSC